MEFILTSDSGIANNVSVSTSSTSAQSLGAHSGPIDVVFQAVDVGVYLRFGGSAVAACSATNSLCYIPAGQAMGLTVRPGSGTQGQGYFTALGGASGTLKWWLT